MKRVFSIFKKKSIRVVLIVTIALFFAATIFAAATSVYRVTIICGDDVKTVTTFYDDAYKVIEQAGFEIEDNDVVDLSDFSSGTSSEITIYKLVSFVIYDDSTEGKEYQFAGTVQNAFDELGIILNDGDTMNCESDDMLIDGMEIRITRAYTIMLSVDGEIVQVNLNGGTVSDALDKAVVTVDDDDEISASLDTPLEKGMTIKITHIEYRERTETEAVAFEKKTEKDSSMYEGQSKIKQAGVNGEQTVTYRDKYVAGQVAESAAIKNDITKNPVSEIKLVGTKKKESASGGVFAGSLKTVSCIAPPSSLTLDGTVPTSYKKKITGIASGYSSDSHTATGKACKPGYIAVNPNQIPYGTKMWIVSNDGRYVYGYASAEDTGGFVNWTGSRATVADLFFATEAQADAFGRRGITIYIL